MQRQCHELCKSVTLFHGVFFFFFYRFDKWKINIMSTFVFWSGLRFYGLFKIESLTWSQISLFLTNNLGKVGCEFIYKNDSKNGI